jgi:Uma2 family endonuclease
MPVPSFRHGRISHIIGYRLQRYLETNRIGTITNETGVHTENGPDTVRGPDIAYWSFEHVPDGRDPGVYAEVPADLCVEVRSPSNTMKSLRDKAAEYLRAGVRMVWVVEPEDRSVTVFRRPGRGVTLWDDELLEGEDVLPGFSCPVSQLFTL